MVGFVDGQEVAIGTPSAAELGIIDDDGKQRKKLLMKQNQIILLLTKTTKNFIFIISYNYEI